MVLFLLLCWCSHPTLVWKQNLSSTSLSWTSATLLVSADTAAASTSTSHRDDEATTETGDNHKRTRSLTQNDVTDTAAKTPRRSSISNDANKKTPLQLNQILLKAGKRGLGGGIPGAIAGAVQVITLMWLRTVINYQMRYGTSFVKALGILYREGGIPRFYRGLAFALVQAPLSRFVSTAANDGVESLLANLEYTASWGPGRSTVVASIVVGFWRMMLMPIDTCKTVLQVDSVEGFRSLMRRVRAGKIGVLYQGAVANAISSIMGHYPWYDFDTRYV